jgi:hypothetical protein
MEAAFGHDFGRVRVHADEQAGELARAVHALAYTVGDHIVFEPGQYAPQTTRGARLLAHELTHVLQQRRGTALVQADAPASDNEAEREARSAADALVGGAPPASPTLEAAPGSIQRLRVEGCEPPGLAPETEAVEKAVSSTVQAIHEAAAKISTDPLPPLERAVLIYYFGQTGPRLQKRIAADLNIIAEGLQTDAITCDYPDSPTYEAICNPEGEFNIAAAHPDTPERAGRIILCMPRARPNPPGSASPTLVHEGAHRFLVASDHNDTYYEAGCFKSSKTRKLTDDQRLHHADSFGCLVERLVLHPFTGPPPLTP